MATGIVKWFNFMKGYGFIEPSDKSKDIFLHISALQKSNIKSIQDGQKISYQVVSEKGKDTATDIELI